MFEFDVVEIPTCLYLMGIVILKGPHSTIGGEFTWKKSSPVASTITTFKQGQIQDFREEGSFSRLARGSGGMPSQKIFEKWPFLRRILAGFQVG